MAQDLLTPAPVNPVNSSATSSSDVSPRGRVTLRAYVLGLLLSSGLAALNAWIENLLNVHFLSGVQMPFGAIFSLAVLVLFVNGPLKRLQRGAKGLGGLLSPLSPTELMAVYVMLLFASLISTPGCDNFFLTTGTTLFYFSTRENRWAEMFYSYIPAHFAPGWDGHTFQNQVIDPLYQGGLSFSQIPWHAWTLMLFSWGVLLSLVYSTLFFLSLVLRRQWIESEALAFPLVQLPLQMVDGGTNGTAPTTAFWGDKTMWAGTALAAGVHLMRGLNNYFPDWPTISSFQGNAFAIELTEVPWNSAGNFNVEIFLGAVGIAYLLTRELSFSFWVFFLLFRMEMVLATMLGFPVSSLPKDTSTLR